MVDSNPDLPGGSFYQGPSSRPDPDPTPRTIQNLQREIASLKELIFTRLDGMDKALIVFTDTLHRVPSDVDRQVGALRELVYETFKSYDGMFSAIDTRLHERDVRFAQAAENNRDSVAAALQAQRESVTEQNRASETAIAKAETATMKQIDQIHLLLQTASAGLDGKINDIKDRMTKVDDRITRIEAQAVGQTTAHATRDTSQTQWVGVIGLVMGALLGIAGLAVAFNSRPEPPQIIERVVGNPTKANGVVP